MQNQTDIHWNEKIRVTLIDRILAATFLKIMPPSITPNQITGFRYILIPFVIYFFLINNFPVGTVLFIFAAFSDALDGALARTKKQITEWGIINDPIADKLLIGSTAIIIISKFLSVTLAFTIILMEMCLIMLYYHRNQGKVIPAKWSGKVKMFFQCVGIISLLLSVLGAGSFFFVFAEISIYLSIFFAFVSLFVYYSI